ncbi:hypothetical protein CDD81_3560 [Ophiocordyceps australis]|uniref:4'-phosphopantetheinyl transferase domain-containing protein n=1 Tax=Ophiocordyceps australis TaxID=1399860 RepID=A0A2C5XPK7_9HYPO|nr:hypothetical protein CDD81_3560 [Ophiocordyceps australis]
MKPLRAFPLALGIGTDICQISRIHGILARGRGAGLVRRVLAPEERSGLVLEGEAWKTSVFLAGRFAAKEAAIKAHHPHRRLTLHDVVIERQTQTLGSGPPVARIRSEDGGGSDEAALVSISHDGDYATAVCVCHAGTRDARNV